MAERAAGILGPRNSERTTDVLAAGVAGHRFLRELLHRRLDGEVDGEADVDRRAADVDAVRPVTIAGGRVVEHGRRVGVKAVQRARRPAQRRERLQHDVERRRYFPALVVDSEIRGGLAGDARGWSGLASIFGDDEHLRARAQLCFWRTRPSHEVGRYGDVGPRRGIAHEDAAREAAPGVRACDLPRGDFDELVRAPTRSHPRHFGAAPGKHAQHVAVRAREHRRGARDVRALHGELASRVIGCFNRQPQRIADRLEPAQRIEAHGSAYPPIPTRAEALQCRA